MGMTPPYLDLSCQEGLYEVDGGAYIAGCGLSEVNSYLSEGRDHGEVAG